MIWVGQTSTSGDIAAYFSTKRTGVSVIKKQGLPDTKEFCPCIVQCIPNLKVFASGDGTDELKNDWTSFFMRTVNSLLSTGSTVTATLTNVDSGSSWTLTDPAYGTIKNGNFYYWFKLDWFKVYDAHGPGNYQVTINEVAISGGATINQLRSVKYSLQVYSDYAANRTVRVYSVHTGNLHHGHDYSNLTVAGNSVPQPFEQQTRLPGRFYAVEPEEENDHLILNNGNRSTYQIKDQLKPKFKFDIHLVGAGQINGVIFDELFGSEVLVTDYNVYNHVSDPRDYTAEQYVEVPVTRSSTGIPNPRATARRRSYTIDFDYDFDNVFKTNN